MPQKRLFLIYLRTTVAFQLRKSALERIWAPKININLQDFKFIFFKNVKVSTRFRISMRFCRESSTSSNFWFKRGCSNTILYAYVDSTLINSHAYVFFPIMWLSHLWKLDHYASTILQVHLTYAGLYMSNLLNCMNRMWNSTRLPRFFCIGPAGWVSWFLPSMQLSTYLYHLLQHFYKYIYMTFFSLFILPLRLVVFCLAFWTFDFLVSVFLSRWNHRSNIVLLRPAAKYKSFSSRFQPFLCPHFVPLRKTFIVVQANGNANVTIPFELRIFRKYLQNPQKSNRILTEGPLFGSLETLNFRIFLECCAFT